MKEYKDTKKGKQLIKKIKSDLDSRKQTPQSVLEDMANSKIDLKAELLNLVLEYHENQNWSSKLDITKVVHLFIKKWEYDTARSYMGFSNKRIVNVDYILYKEIADSNPKYSTVTFLKEQGANLNNAFLIAIESAQNKQNLEKQIEKYKTFPEVYGTKEAFFMAVNTNKYGPVSALLSNEIVTDVNNMKDKWGHTKPLHIASHHGYIEIAELLIEQKHGADINNLDRSGKTPLHLALQNNQYEMAKFLLSKGANETNIMEVSDPVAVVHSLFDPNPLHTASHHGYIEIAKLLIAHGADINNLDRSGKTPLHLALQNNQYDMAKFLLSNEANIMEVSDPVEIFGLNALHHASQHGYIEIAKLLIEHGADINNLDRSGKTPLFYIRSDDMISEINKAAQNFLELCELYKNHQNPPEGIPDSKKMAVYRECYKQSVKNGNFASIKFIFEHTIDSITWNATEVKKVLDILAMDEGDLRNPFIYKKLPQFLDFTIGRIANNIKNENICKILASQDLKLYIMRMLGGDLDLSLLRENNKLITDVTTNNNFLPLNEGDGTGETIECRADNQLVTPNLEYLSFSSDSNAQIEQTCSQSTNEEISDNFTGAEESKEDVVVMGDGLVE